MAILCVPFNEHLPHHQEELELDIDHRPINSEALGFASAYFIHPELVFHR